MTKVRLIRSAKTVDFESALNQFLEQISGLKLVDIKYSATYDGHEDVFTALVIYEEL